MLLWLAIRRTEQTVAAISLVSGLLAVVTLLNLTLVKEPVGPAITLIITTMLTTGLLWQMHQRQTARQNRLFQVIDFGKSDGPTKTKAAQEILASVASKPYFVHIAPEAQEVAQVVKSLKQSQWALISGTSGSGKSLAGYQAAHRYQKESAHGITNWFRPRFQVYEFKTLDYTGTSWEGLDQRLQQELAEMKHQVILVNDIQFLSFAQQLTAKLRERARSGTGPSLIIKTYFSQQEEAQDNDEESIQIDFDALRNKLTHEFYHSPDPAIQLALAPTNTPDLKAAEQRSEANVEIDPIRDPWEFNFVASRQESRLVNQVHTLGNSELIALFAIASLTVMSRGRLVDKYTLIMRLSEYAGQPGKTHIQDWLDEKNINDAIKVLRQRHLIREYSDGKITCHHLRVAERIVSTCLTGNVIQKQRDLINSLPALAARDQQFSYLAPLLSIFRRSQAELTSGFIHENHTWLANYLAKAHLQEIAFILALTESDPNDYETVIDLLATELLARNFNAETNRHEGMIRIMNILMLINTLGNSSRNRFLRVFIDPTRLEQLVKIVTSLKAGDLEWLVSLLHILDEHKPALISRLDLTALAATASNAQRIEFAQIKRLVQAFDNQHKAEFRAGLTNQPNLDRLLKTVVGVTGHELYCLTDLLEALGPNRARLITRLDLPTLAAVAGTGEITSQQSSVTSLLIALGQHADKFIAQMPLTILAEKASRTHIYYRTYLSDFLDALGNRRDEFVRLMDFDLLAQTIQADRTENTQDNYDLNYTKLLEALRPNDHRLTEAIEQAKHINNG